MTESSEGIDAIASRWAVRLSVSPLGEAEQESFDRWLEADTRHRGALLRAQAAWLDLDRLAALQGGRVVAEESTPALQTPPSRRRWFVAAGVAAMTLAGFGSWWLHRGTQDEYISQVGEVRRVTLADGSTLSLNTASRAIVRFDKSRREVELLGGEGLFEVAKDPNRPFIVHVGSVSVRAVGTVFGVQVADQRVDVTVTEGAVEVTPAQESPETGARRVTANEQAVVISSRAVEVRPIRGDRAERHFAWREGMVDFDGESLADAVAEINRHNRRKIVVDDPALASRPVVGIFRASDAAGFAVTVAAALGASRVDTEDGIRLQPRPAQ